MVCCLIAGLAQAEEPAEEKLMTDGSMIFILPPEAVDTVAAQSDVGDWGAPLSALDAALQTLSGGGCAAECSDSSGSCSSATQCNSICQSLVGENGFCMPGCDCCICPDVQEGGGDDPWGGGSECTPVCRCDGVPGNQGVCPSGCRQVNCI